MGLLARMLGREVRGAAPWGARASSPYLAEVFGLGGPQNVAPDAVLSNLAVAARCVALRSELLASVGLGLYRRDGGGGRSRADDNPLYGVLHDLANPNMTAFEAREFLIRSLDLTGNAYARIEISGRGQVAALYPLVPASVGVERLPNGRLRFRVTEPTGGVTVLLQDEVLHIRGPSRDGLLGLSPIAISRGALSFALAQNETAQSLTGNALRPSGLLSFAERLGLPAKENIRDSMQQYVGSANAGKLLIMDGGAKFEKLTFSPDEAEFLDSRKLAAEDVARIFGMPPTTVGITDKATYSNTEQEARARAKRPGSAGEAGRDRDDAVPADRRRPTFTLRRARPRHAVARRREGPLRGVPDRSRDRRPVAQRHPPGRERAADSQRRPVPPAGQLGAARLDRADDRDARHRARGGCLTMSRRSALVTQAEIARAVKATMAAGLTVVRVVMRPDGVTIETAAGQPGSVATPAGPPRKPIVL